MARKTIKIGDAVRLTSSVYFGQYTPGIVTAINNGQYTCSNALKTYTASEIERVPDKPLPKKRTPLPKPTSKINPISDKRSKQLRAYKVLADKFRQDNKICKRCEMYTENIELHHAGGRENELLLDTTKWIPLCHDCHQIITANSKLAIELELSISRNKK